MTAVAAAETAASEEPDAQLIHPVQFDDAGRALVRISLDGKVPAAAVLQSLRGRRGVEVIASDMNYRAGVIEAYVPTELAHEHRHAERACSPSCRRARW